MATYYEAPHHEFSLQREPPQRMVYDGKRMRKQITRKTVDFNATVIANLEHRIQQRNERDLPLVQPWPTYIRALQPPSAYEDNPMTSVCTKFVHTSINKVRCPINVTTWTPEGRRLITGASSGEFTLWNGLTFNFETILQAHDTAVRAMVWSHNENWMVTGDHGGTVKYWQSNMNNVKAFQAHNEAVRDITFCPTDLKFATCSDDVTIKIWDFARCEAEKTLQGHGGDVKCISWHPFKSLLASGSKDNFVKIWDARTGKNITTLHGHKNTILSVKCNKNGNWLLSASRDQLVKLFDLRMMKEMHSFRGHKREVTCVAWHPFHEDFFCSGSFDGTILYWTVGTSEPVAEIIGAHESSVWDLAWHPLGHILCSGSNDHTTKFWCRNRPGDTMKDKYNTLGGTAVADAPEAPAGAGGAIPGLGLGLGSGPVAAPAIPGFGGPTPAPAAAPAPGSGAPPPVSTSGPPFAPPHRPAHPGPPARFSDRPRERERERDGGDFERERERDGPPRRDRERERERDHMREGRDPTGWGRRPPPGPGPGAAPPPRGFSGPPGPGGPLPFAQGEPHAAPPVAYAAAPPPAAYQAAAPPPVYHAPAPPPAAYHAAAPPPAAYPPAPYAPPAGPPPYFGGPPAQYPQPGAPPPIYMPQHPPGPGHPSRDPRAQQRR